MAAAAAASACSGRSSAPSTATSTRDHGVELLAGTGVEAFEGRGSVERVRTGDGRTIDADFVVVGVGVAPRTEPRRGRRARRRQRHPRRRAPARPARRRCLRRRRRRQRRPPVLGQRIRVEHWANALNQGPAAARNMLGAGRRLRPHPVLLLRPVRRRHGVRRLRARTGTRSCSAATSAPASSSPSGSATAACSPA